MTQSSPTGSVTQWIQDIKQGNGDAAELLWQAYFERMVQLANKKTRHAPKQESDEEDIALQALNSFFDGARKGRFPILNDRNDLWSLLASIVENKSKKLLRRHAALKRGGDRQRVDYNLNHIAAGSVELPSLDELCLEVREQLEKLQDEQLRQIVILRLHGYTNAEIATELDINVRTVERRRSLVRKRWEQMA